MVNRFKSILGGLLPKSFWQQNESQLIPKYPYCATSENLLHPQQPRSATAGIIAAKVSWIGKFKSNPQMDAPVGGSPSKS